MIALYRFNVKTENASPRGYSSSTSSRCGVKHCEEGKSATKVLRILFTLEAEAAADVLPTDTLERFDVPFGVDELPAPAHPCAMRSRERVSHRVEGQADLIDGVRRCLPLPVADEPPTEAMSGGDAAGDVGKGHGWRPGGCFRYLAKRALHSAAIGWRIQPIPRIKRPCRGASRRPWRELHQPVALALAVPTVACSSRNFWLIRWQGYERSVFRAADPELALCLPRPPLGTGRRRPADEPDRRASPPLGTHQPDPEDQEASQPDPGEPRPRPHGQPDP
ncbi:hypothetical protein AZL_002240 [Azospirillum sp. B510]|nr:hypothetical protein AZL_002240 [Azospirillum sp. B510]